MGVRNIPSTSVPCEYIPSGARTATRFDERADAGAGSPDSISTGKDTMADDDEFNAFGAHDDAAPAVEPPTEYDLGDEDDGETADGQ